MYNPSYLVQSRHDVYYFRYPLPIKPQRRVSISLKTRCPKLALRLSKVLEYYSIKLLEGMDLNRMDHAEIVSILKGHYTEALDHAKARIDKEGQLPKQNIDNITRHLKELDELIDNQCDDVYELLGLEANTPEESLVHQDLKPILEKYELEFDPDSKEYRMMKEAYKFARRNYFQDLLAYNRQVTDYSLIQGQSISSPEDHFKPTHKLQTVIDKYVSEITGSMEKKSLNELTTCLRYLIELYGEDYSITKINGDEARYAKECLLKTPSRRNTKKETKDLTLLEQIKVEGLPLFAPRTVNKYLEYFSGLFKWAVNHKYLKENPFDGMNVKDRKDGKREDFNDAELALIFTELNKGKDGLAKDDLRYWSTLIFLYTGARRNEIASLTPDNVLHDTDNDIHYFKIKDEKKSKREGRDSFRYVPVHSDLIKRGFLEYVEKVRAMKGKDLRLLHQLTYTDKHGWGKKLTYWFSNVLLPELEIKRSETSLHSTRHTFITRMKETDTEYAIIDAMVGHQGKGIGETVYTHRSERHLPAFKDAIEKLRY